MFADLYVNYNFLVMLTEIAFINIIFARIILLLLLLLFVKIINTILIMYYIKKNEELNVYIIKINLIKLNQKKKKEIKLCRGKILEILRI